MRGFWGMTPEILAALTALIEPGLVAGLGTAAPGGMCIEAAVSLAVHGTFGDTPPCVAAPDRGYAMWVNDARWSSPRARAAALLPCERFGYRCRLRVSLQGCPPGLDARATDDHSLTSHPCSEPDENIRLESRLR